MDEKEAHELKACINMSEVNSAIDKIGRMVELMKEAKLLADYLASRDIEIELRIKS